MSETPVLESYRPTVGSIFRNARELIGVKLEEAAAVTRISRAYLSALEEDRFDRLPSEAYTKGFIRAYAKFLDIPEQDVMAAYVMSFRPDISQENLEEMLQEQGPAGSGANVGGRRIILILIPALALAAAISFFFLREDMNSPQEPTPALTGSAGKIAAPTPVAVLDSKEQNAHAVNRDLEEVRTEPNVSKVTGMVLRLKAMEDTSLDITIDDVITQHYDLKDGDLIEWKAEKGFALELDNAGGVEAELNGKPLAPLGVKGERTHVELMGEEHELKTAP